MADITLTCRLHKKPEKHSIRVNTGDTVDSLIGEIKRAFDCNEARDIVLWKTEMPNEPEDTFTNLVLTEGDNLTELTTGELNRFWGEDLSRPLEDHTHVIIDSPALMFKQEIDRLREKSELYLDENASDYIIPAGSRTGGSYLKDLFHAKVIRVNDVLRIKKGYMKNKRKLSVHIQCRVTNFDDGILSVMLIDRNEEQKEGIFLLEQLEEWLLEHSLDAEDRPGSYEHSGDNIEIIRNERLLGSIRMRRNCYIYNQKNREDSTKSESKQDADLSETLSRLSIKKKKNQSTAKYINGQRILTDIDDDIFTRLENLSDKFWSTYRKDTPSLSYMSSGLVNEKPAIIAYVDIPKGTLVELPAEFEGCPVFIDYGAIEPACYTSPVALSPGVSISCIFPFTLGALFKAENENEIGKSFILTVKHGVGNIDDEIIQLGSAGADKGYTICAKVTKYSFYGVIYEDNEYGRDALLLDYAFCEVINSEIVSTSNTPILREICINDTKDSVSGCNHKYKICKVGGSTGYTEGSITDRLKDCNHREFGDVKALIVKSKSSEDVFGAPGDSGSPVFDKHNKLWGILQGTSPNGLATAVVPIHLILRHVRGKFGVSFKLINE